MFQLIFYALHLRFIVVIHYVIIYLKPPLEYNSLLCHIINQQWIIGTYDNASNYYTKNRQEKTFFKCHRAELLSIHWGCRLHIVHSASNSIIRWHHDFIQSLVHIGRCHREWYDTRFIVFNKVKHSEQYQNQNGQSKII